MNKLQLLLIILTLITPLTPVTAEEANSQATAKDRPATRKMLTPQDTVAEFSRLMFSGTGKGGDTRDLAHALDFIEPQPGIKRFNQKNELLKQAKDLFALLKSVNYTLDDINIIENDGKRALIELGDNDSDIRLYMTYSDQHGWIFAGDNFISEDFTSALKHINSITENITEHSDEFILDLSSPLNTAYTFIYGVQNLYGYNMQDAVRALNLTNHDPLVAAELGANWAVQIYRMLRYSYPIKPESLSNNPYYDGNIVLLLDPDFGMLEMKLSTDSKTGMKAWKIEYSGDSNINGIYDSYMKMGMANVIRSYNTPHLPLHVILDDFFQIHFPTLENKFLYMNIWKIFLIALLILLSIMAIHLIRITFLPLINFTMKKFNINTSNESNKRFILPLQIILISLLWLYGLVIILANPAIMLISIVALKVVLCFAISLLLCRTIDVIIVIAAYKFDTTLQILTGIIGKILKIIIIISASLYICEVFGVNTRNYLAALGIGGFALALAGKDTIENFFGSIMIIIDRPFHTGDYIKVGDIDGEIQQVGVRSTKILTLNDTVVTVPNRLFISSAVENLGMRKWRRYQTSFDILYETDIAKIREFTHGLTELAHLHPDSRKDRIQVFFHSLGTSSLEIYINIFFRNRGRLEELKAREAFNLQAMTLAQKLGIEFAYPTQKLYLARYSASEPETLSESNIPPAYTSARPATTTNDSSISTGIKVSPGILLAREISPYYKEPEEKKPE